MPPTLVNLLLDKFNVRLLTEDRKPSLSLSLDSLQSNRILDPNFPENFRSRLTFAQITLRSSFSLFFVVVVVVFVISILFLRPFLILSLLPLRLYLLLLPSSTLYLPHLLQLLSIQAPLLIILARSLAQS